MNEASNEQRLVWTTPQLTYVDTGLETVRGGIGVGGETFESSTTSGFVV